jgi:hypothetical protein
MRQSRPDLQARVNGDLSLEFGDVTLTTYAGLELFARYLRGMRFNALVRDAFAGTRPRGDYGVLVMVRLLIGLLIVGGRRLRHLAYVQDDPVFRRFGGVRVVPSARTMSRWLKTFTMTTVGRLQALNAAVVARALPGLRLRTLTIDVDGVVVSTGLQVERAFRGFNPHHRKVPSYYPILAHLAETTHLLRVKNRSGNVHDGKASLPFLRELSAQLATMLAPSDQVRFRMDGAFFRQDVLRWLHAQGAGYTIKVPFYTWLDLQQSIRGRRDWVAVAPDISGFALPVALTARPVRPERWVLRILRGREQSEAHDREPLALHGRARESREDDWPTQKWVRVSHGAHQRLRRQQCLAATGRARAQSADELPDRHRRHAARRHAEADGAPSAPDGADAAIRDLSSSGHPPASGWDHALAHDGQRRHAADIHPHRERPGPSRLSFLTH